MILRLDPETDDAQAPAAPFEIGGERTLLGRGDGADLQLDDPQVSAIHCEIRRVAGGFEVLDLESRNGTWVNDRRVASQLLRSGDLLRCGGTVLRVLVVAGSSTVPARPQAAHLGPLESTRPALVPPQAEPWQPHSPGSWALLDAAVAGTPGLALLRTCPEQVISLFVGLRAEQLAEVAPYLVDLAHCPAAVPRALLERYGAAWATFLRSDAAREDLLASLRRLLLVDDPDGRPCLLRFWDPRVLRTLLPTCGDDQLAAFFARVDEWIVENPDDGDYLRFGHRHLGLDTTRLPIPKAAVANG